MDPDHVPGTVGQPQRSKGTWGEKIREAPRPSKTCGQPERPSDGQRGSPRCACPPLPGEGSVARVSPGPLCLRVPYVCVEHRAVAVPDKGKSLRTDFDML